MNILHVILAFYPNQVWGGPPRIAFTLAKGLKQRGHQVQVLSTNILDHQNKMSKTSFQGDWHGLPVTYLNTIWKGRRSNSIGFIYSSDLLKYRHLFHDADVVHIHGYRHFLFNGASLFAKLYSKPVILQAHGTLTGQFGRTRLKELYDGFIGRLLLSYMGAVVLLCKEEYFDAQRLGVSQEKLVKILNPIDFEEYPSISNGENFRNKYGISQEKRVILFLSRIHEKKGLDLLIEAVSILQDDTICLCVVGFDDGFLDKAKKLVELKKLNEQVVFTGPLYDTEKYEAYSAADVYVLPTRGSEGLPTTVLEACLAGTPVIVTKTTEIAEMIHERVGLAAECTPDSIAMALQTLLSNNCYRQELASHTKEFLDEYFSLDHALDEYELLYKKVIQESKGN